MTGTTTSDGYSIGINVALPQANQSLTCISLVIPRYKGDEENPKGGARGVIPDQAGSNSSSYWIWPLIADACSWFRFLSRIFIRAGRPIVDKLIGYNSVQAEPVDNKRVHDGITI